jgi:hypothetical protein
MSASAVTVKERPPAKVRRAQWLLLIHQIPPKPDYFRVKVRRRLQRIGAVALKNSVYILPRTRETIEDFRWLLREIGTEGGDATLCEADFVEGITQREIEALFGADRDAEYTAIIHAAEQLGPSEAATELPRLRRRLEEAQAIDYFGAPARPAAERALARIESQLNQAPAGGGKGVELMRGNTWVTRRDVFIDRIASAWLIRRFIDPEAQFKFVGSKGYQRKAGEVRFDMYEAEYTHEGGRCTFETLLLRAGLRDRALRAIGEIVHDIDCKDEKFARAEAPGVAALLRGLVRSSADDTNRLERGAALFDQLYTSLR